MRLRSRFTLLFFVLAAAAGFFLAVTFDSTLRRAVEDRSAERIRREVDHLADDLYRLRAGEAEERDRFLRKAAADLSCRVTVIAPDGLVLHETNLSPSDVARMENHGNRPEVRAAKARGMGEARRFSATEQEERIYFARLLESGEILRLSLSAARLREIERGYLWPARLAIFGSCFFLFLIGAAASRRFSRPIGELTEAASSIASGEIERNLPSSGGEEVQLLGAALQRMKNSLARLAQRADAERRLTSMVFEQLPDGLVVVDEKLSVLESNRQFSRMIGIPAPVGRALYDLLRHRSLCGFFEASVRTRRTAEETFHLSDDIVWRVTVAPLPEGARGAVVGVFRDITHLERTETMRRTFVADVSHELRTPIASIAAAAETLAEGDPDQAETAHLLGLIRRQSGRMRELIDDLVDLAQIESGAVELQREKLSLLALLREIAADFAPPAAEKRIRVVVEGDDSVTVEADRRRVGQIVRNLLDNAIKFSPEGKAVALRAGRDGGEAFFSVTDEGPGILPSERDKIFQRFYQVDRSRSKIRPGTGLGLAIVKHLVQLHAARLELESDVGRGSTFRVGFPHKP